MLVKMAKLELAGFDKIYRELLDKHNALLALEPCCCNCQFCDDAARRFNNVNRPCNELMSCEACDEITQSADYIALHQRCERLRTIIKQEERKS